MRASRMLVCGLLLGMLCCVSSGTESVTGDGAITRWAPLPWMWGQDGLTPAAAALLTEGTGEDRLRAAFVLGQVGTPGALGALRGAAEDTDRMVRVHVGVALAQSGMPTSAACEAALWEGPRWLQFYAIHGLNQIGSVAARRRLAQTTAGDDVFINDTLRAAAGGRAPRPTGPLTPEPLTAENAGDLLTVAANALVDEADVWFDVGKYDQCIRCNEAAIFLEPERTDLYGVNGWLLWSMNRHGAAITTYRRAIAANPGEWDAYFELGFYYMHHTQVRSAVRHLHKSVELGAPPVAARSYAHALEKAGRSVEALQFWEQLDKVDGTGVVDSNIARLRELLDGAVGAGGN